MPTYTAASLPDLTGRTAIVTGGNSGVGRATAHALAGAGARVIIAVRNLEKGRAAARAMPGAVQARALDLADLGSVRAFADGWEDEIDLLINNAGVSVPQLERTVDGFELQLATNHLGHFALTNLLLAHITGRVVTVASQAERMGRLDLDDLGYERGGYRQSAAYGRSKLANLLFTSELQRRLTAAGSPVLAQAAHPGLVRTEIYGESGPFGRLMVATGAQSPAQGALAVLYAALADIPGDSFTGPSRLMHMRGAPQLIRRSRRARDRELAARLWTVSEQLTGVEWPVAAQR